MRIAVGLALIAVLGSLPNPAPAQDSKNEAAVRTADDQERAAVLKGDRQTLERLWSDQLTVNAPTGKVNVGREKVLELIQRGTLHYSSFERSIEAVRLFGDVAVVMGQETARPVGESPGAVQVVQRRFTNVWKKEGGTWHMIARQASTVPTQPAK